MIGQVRGRPSWWIVVVALFLLVQIAGCARAKPPELAPDTPTVGLERTLVAQAYPPPTTPVPILELPSPTPTPTEILIPYPLPTETPVPYPQPTVTPSPTVLLATPTPSPLVLPATPTPPPLLEITPLATPHIGDVIHIVTRSETLFSLARRYGTTVQAIMIRNGLRDPNRIYAGQRLVIPIGYMPQETVVPQLVRHWVQRSETLFSIARRYRTSVAEILAHNPGITDPNYLPVGTLLTVPINTQPFILYHTVRRGETVASISRRYGVSMQALVAANGLVNPNHVYVGQVLVIPR
jgi:LysM repeat protein